MAVGFALGLTRTQVQMLPPTHLLRTEAPSLAAVRCHASPQGENGVAAFVHTLSSPPALRTWQLLSLKPRLLHLPRAQASWAPRALSPSEVLS